MNFYPSIDRQLLQKAIHFAKRFTTISPSEAEIIFQAKNNLLFHGNMSWQKATADDLFDVTMGSYDGAETCELVGSFILDEIKSIVPKENIGLYRDDGPAVIHKPARAAETIKKKLCEKFRKIGLQVTASANSTVVDFLDVTFDLNSKEHKPFSKPGNTQLVRPCRFQPPANRHQEDSAIHTSPPIHNLQQRRGIQRRETGV